MGVETARILVIADLSRADATLAALHPLRQWMVREERDGRLSFTSTIRLMDAFEALRGRGHDTVICDLAPYGEGGLDLVRELRARGHATPFVLIAGDPREADYLARAQILAPVRILTRDHLTPGLLTEAVQSLLALTPAGPPSPAGPGEGWRAEGEARIPASRSLAPAMLWRTDPAGRFEQFSRRWLAFTGRAEEKERGVGWLDSLHPADLDSWVRVYSSALGARQEFRIDVRLRAAGDDFRWLRFHGVPGFNDAGEFSGYVGSAFEIDDLKREIATSRARVERAEVGLRDIEAFLHAALHDLQEPLRTLQRDLQTLSGERSSEALANVQRMQGRLVDLLECARLTTRGQPLEPVDLTAPLDWALENLRALIEESGAQITHDPLPIVKADATQMAGVFQNLLSNAIKFREDSPSLVHLGVTRSADEWRFWVQDNGRGIAPEFHEVIFEPFRRLPGSDSDGRGMGLAICKRIVERHGGRLWLESEPGHGATFFFSLPRD